MASNNIQNLVDEIFEFVEEYGRTPFGSSNKVTLPKDQLYLLLDELEKTIPKEMERFQKTYNQRDAIIQDAEKRLPRLLQKRKKKVNGLCMKVRLSIRHMQRHRRLWRKHLPQQIRI